MLLTLIAFFFAIGLLVTVHEYGHYRVAKYFGVKILTFSIGFGKPLLQWQRGETQWQIAAIPLGGFVRMLGEDEDSLPIATDLQRTFSRQHPLRKMAIVVAGPLANLLLACVFFAAALMIGLDSIKPVVGSVRVGSVAEQAGLRSGDEVVRLGSMDILDWEDLRLAALAQLGEEMSVLVRAQGDQRELVFNLGKASVDASILGKLGLSPVPLLNRIAEVEAGGVAARAGLMAGDVVQAVNDRSVTSWEQLQAQVANNPGREISLNVLRGEEVRIMKLTPQAAKTEQGMIGRIGVAPQVDEARYEHNRFTLRLGPIDALLKGGEKSWMLTRMTVQMIGRMLSGGLSSSNVSGPIGIASLAGKSASLGLAVYLQFLALVSLSLGVLNLLPVPVLDGGHLLYHSAELVRGRPLPASWQVVGQRVGLALLIGLMLLAFYNDITLFIPH